MPRINTIPPRSTTVGDIIMRLLPSGSQVRFTVPSQERSGAPSWVSFPRWPADLFAVAASLVEISGCYRIGFPDDDSADKPFSAGWASYNQDLGQRWRIAVGKRDNSHVAQINDALQYEWEQLLSSRDLPVDQATNANGALEPWCAAALRLMAVADEACHGIGFALAENTGDYPFALAHQLSWTNRAKDGNLPLTICEAVPPQEVCVQPKALTPHVGCCLRNLSHHLALLPPNGQVATRWGLLPVRAQSSGPFNLLVVPFPYRVSSRCWKANQPHKKEGWGNFDFTQNWLDTITKEELVSFLGKLITLAMDEVVLVHGVVLPELALNTEFAEYVADRLINKFGVEVFISGEWDKSAQCNLAYTAINREEGEYIAFHQPKHHRWCLDRGQITRYSLGDALDPELFWWEGISIPPREVFFHELRSGAVMVALVCEDLARIDPVQRVVRAIGPNLVVAILLDGPQLKHRWPAQYASVLSDDPGSSVLTVTSLGMVLRSRPGGSRIVALWREAGSEARELCLPPRAHALLLTLTGDNNMQRTLDRRSDAACAVQLRLTGVRPVVYPDPVPPWTKSLDGVD